MKKKSRWKMASLPLCLALIGLTAFRPMQGKKKIVQEDQLTRLIKDQGIQSVIEIPSKKGEILNQKELDLKKYIRIVNTREEMLNSPTNSLYAEIALDLLPKSDLILAWDHLNRLLSNQIPNALVQFKKSGAKYLLLNHDPKVKKNKKNRDGSFEPINWTIPPYQFPQPIKQFKTYALWSLETLP